MGTHMSLYGTNHIEFADNTTVSSPTMKKLHCYGCWEPTGPGMFRQQSPSQCGENKGDCHRLQEKASTAPCIYHERCCCGEGELLGVHISTLLLPLQTEESPSASPIMCSFDRGTVESIFTGCITVWSGVSTASSRKTLQHMVNRASKIISASLTSHIRIRTLPLHTRIFSTRLSILYFTFLFQFYCISQNTVAKEKAVALCVLYMK